VDPDAVFVVNGVGQGVGVLDGVVIVKGKASVLGMNFGRPIVTSWDILS